MMSYQIVWAEKAIRNIEAIFAFLKMVNPPVAQKYHDEFAKFESIVCNMPEIAQCWLADPNYRCWSIYPYKIFYRVSHAEKQVSIVAVTHGRQQDPNLP